MSFARGLAACWPKFAGENERPWVRVGASEHGWMGELCAFRGVGGDPTGPWPCRWHARITQRRRVGELQPESFFLGVGGQFHDLVKRTENRKSYVDPEHRLRGGASGRAQPVAFARHARCRLAGLARRTGRGRATVVSGKVMVYLYEILTRFGPERSRENERIARAI